DTGYKIAAAMSNARMKSIIAKSARRAQKGSLPDAQCVELAVTMGARDRIAAMALKALESDPLMMTFGSGDAFPSTCRDFLPQVLRHGGCPRSVLNVVDAIYVSPLAWINLSGTMQDLFHRARRLKRRVGGICAGDAGAALPSMQMSRPLSSTFYAAKHLARLALEALARQMAPPAAVHSTYLETRVQTKLAKLAPRWANAQVAPTAKYLGALLGPSVTSDARWKKA
ncbi:unnamed protein product, partial [Prorocentrum cordatum]